MLAVYVVTVVEKWNWSRCFGLVKVFAVCVPERPLFFLCKLVHWFLSLECVQDAQDAYLEQRREIALTEKISIIQKCIRMWAVRRRFLKMRGSCTIIQSRWRAYSARKRFLAVSWRHLLVILVKILSCLLDCLWLLSLSTNCNLYTWEAV